MFTLRPSAAFLLLSAATVRASDPLAPYGAVPSARQRAWHETELYCLVHFGPNTFLDQEWGFGDAPPSIFNPTDFDAEQIVAAAKNGGARGLVLVAKHHDGFCLWPSDFTEYSVRNSPWRDGKGDMVREFEQACRKLGLKFGVYLSPWDRNHADYGRPAYLDCYRNQLRELCTNYGPLFMNWFDGANGGDGHYGGARETRRIDRRTYYEWELTWTIVRELQPMSCIFSDVGWDVRWVGNEAGLAGETCWATFTPVGKSSPDSPAPGDTDDKLGIEGTRGGKFWMPAECDVPLRPGWFWHESQNDKVKSPVELVNLYYASVGRGAALDIGIAPDRRGLLHENDARALAGLGDYLKHTFARNLAAGSSVSVTDFHGAAPVRADGGSRFEAGNMLDGDPSTFWLVHSAITSAEIVFDLGDRTKFDVVRIREAISLGQRIGGFEVDVWSDARWEKAAEATSIGACRLIRLKTPAHTSKVRLRITEAAATPALAEFGLYCESRGN